MSAFFIRLESRVCNKEMIKVALPPFHLEPIVMTTRSMTFLHNPLSVNRSSVENRKKVKKVSKKGTVYDVDWHDDITRDGVVEKASVLDST